MSSFSLQTLNYSLAAPTRSLLSTKADKLVGNSAWLKCGKNVPLSLRFQNNQDLRTIECRVASLDVPKLDEAEESTAEGRQVITDPEESIDYIKNLLRTTGDGRISVSPYDTAWVAMIKSLDGSDLPEFPSALKWIAQNQLSDGSWGDEHFFCAYDRLVNTLACVVALRTWNIHHEKSEKGILYIRDNVDSLKDANVEHMTCGFEVVFPALLEKAQGMGIQGIPYEAPVIREIHDAREQKMKRIPLELMHKVSTSLLFSLEGLENLDWEKLLKLQSADGSFLTSPSSTAFAFMQTKDEKCYEFIRNTVKACNGGAPHTYPVDVFGRLWAVDRLQRLGISRFFEDEIAELLRHLYSCWSNKGVFSGRDSEFVDIDDTSMGFRLLRQQGYDVDPIVFMNFKNGDKFSCYGGQIIESSSPIYNLYRACQVAFPGETLLEEAKNFAYNFLQEQLANDNLLDKWVISERLPDEIRLGLEMPWYATLPRVLSRFYLEHYAGADDVWIGKTLYRMPEISNNVYRQLAKSDFKKCQAQHQMEWLYMQEWYDNCNVEEFGVTRKDLLRDYFLAASTIFETERSKERIAWAKSQIIARMIRYFFSRESTTLEQKNAFVEEIRNINGHQRVNGANSNSNILVATLGQFLSGFDKFMSQQLKQSWGVWLMKLQQEDQADSLYDAELLVTTLNICAGRIVFNEEILSHMDYKTLSHLTNKICYRLSEIENIKERVVRESSLMDESVQQDMKSLAKLVLEGRLDGIDRNVKQTFLSVVKTFYYRAYFAPQTIDMHMFKVLFEPVV